MSIEIEIQGLNQRQRVLADIIWSCNSRDNVDAFIKGLPTLELRREAKSIVDMMVMAVVEQAYDGLGTMDAAQSVLRKYNKKKS